MTAFLIVAVLIVLLAVGGRLSVLMDADQPADPMRGPNE